MLLGKKGSSLSTETKAPLLRTTPMQLIEHREVKLMPIWSPYTYFTLFGAGRYSADWVDTSTDTKPLPANDAR